MKLKRHSKIIELVGEYDIETQEELAELLRKNGFEVTQATVSRDSREIKLTKVLTTDGKYKYAVAAPSDRHVNDRYIRVFKEGVVSIDYAQNILIIKTLVGTAPAVAAAFDSMNNAESVGCIAGNDIIFCVTKTEAKAMSMMNKLKAHLTNDRR